MKRKTVSQPVIYAFIDSQNLNLGIRSLGWKLDFERFFVYLQDKYRVRKAFSFHRVRGWKRVALCKPAESGVSCSF